MVIACIALLWITRTASYWEMAVQLLALGAGLGLIVPPMTSSLLGSVERSRSGIASGTLFAMRQTGSVTGVALFGSLIAGSFIAGMHAALGISIGVMLASVLMGLTIARRGAVGDVTH